MKKLLLGFVACLLTIPLAFGLSACGKGGGNNGGGDNDTTQSVTLVTVTPTTYTFTTETPHQFTATVVAKNGADNTVFWLSSDNMIATVDDNGLVTPFSNGTATITATSNFDTNQYGTSTITVNLSNGEHEHGVYFVSVNSNNSRIYKIGDTTQLSANVSVTDSDISQDVTWQSSNNAIATVDANGLVTAVAEGNVDITATSVADTTKHGSMTVRVTPVTLILSETTVSLKKVNGSFESKSITLTAKCENQNLDIRGDVVWTTSNNSVVNVSSYYNDGSATIGGIGNGNATITATFTYQNIVFTATVTVTVDASEHYTVSFVVPQGNTPIPYQIVKSGEKATIPSTNPQRFGYVFAGWDFDLANTAITETKTVNATWTLETSYTNEAEIILGAWKLVNSSNTTMIGAYMLLTAEYKGDTVYYNLITSRQLSFSQTAHIVEPSSSIYGEQWTWNSTDNSIWLYRMMYSSQSNASSGVGGSRESTHNYIKPTISLDGNTMTFTASTIMKLSGSGFMYANGSATYTWERVNIAETPWAN